MHSTEAHKEIRMTALFWGFDADWWNNIMVGTLIFGAVAALAVAIATRGAVVVTKRQATADSQALERYKAEAAERVSNAQGQAVEANERAAVAAKDAADANVVAEHERLERLKIEERLALITTPRNLTTAQIQHVRVAVDEFSGTPFDCAIYSDDESEHLLTQIVSALKSAGWVYKDFALPNSVTKPVYGLGTVGITTRTGISITFNRSRMNFDPAVRRLAQALVEAGVVAESQFSLDDEISDVVHVRVGKKPLK